MAENKAVEEIKEAAVPQEAEAPKAAKKPAAKKTTTKKAAAEKKDEAAKEVKKAAAKKKAKKDEDDLICCKANMINQSRIGFLNRDDRSLHRFEAYLNEGKKLLMT